MAKYLYRSCPKCGDYLGVVIPEPPEPEEEGRIDATCLRCGYRLDLRIILPKNALKSANRPPPE